MNKASLKAAGKASVVLEKPRLIVGRGFSCFCLDHSMEAQHLLNRIKLKRLLRTVLSRPSETKT
jgi:hypothetical protein